MIETQEGTVEGIDELLEPEAKKVLQNQGRFENDEETRFGLESEFGLLKDGRAVEHDERQDVIEDTLSDEDEDWVDTELGESMIEIKTEPHSINSLRALETSLINRENQLLQEVSNHGMDLSRYGTVPLVDIQNISLSEPEDDADRYWELVNAFDEIRKESVGTLDDFGRNEKVDPNTAATPAMTCSTQINWQGQSLDETIERANYAQMISPYGVALSGASRIVSGKDTGYPDTRMQLWEMNFNHGENPNKVGALGGYYGSVEEWLQSLDIFADSKFDGPKDYEEDEASPMDTAIKEDWNDVKIKLVEDGETGNEYSVLEVRPYSMQPTPAEEVAVHGFTTGRVAWAMENDEELMDYDRVLENRERAMEKGLNAETMFYMDDGEISEGPTEEVLRNEIQKAREGLEELGIEDPGYLDILEERTYHGSLSDSSAEIFDDLRDKIDEDEAFLEAVPTYDEPIWDHENPLQTHYETA